MCRRLPFTTLGATSRWGRADNNGCRPQMIAKGEEGEEGAKSAVRRISAAPHRRAIEDLGLAKRFRVRVVEHSEVGRTDVQTVAVEVPERVGADRVHG